jgi:hypothetical protein
MKAEDFGALGTAKLLNGPFKTPHCSLDYRFKRDILHRYILKWTTCTMYRVRFVRVGLSRVLAMLHAATCCLCKYTQSRCCINQGAIISIISIIAPCINDDIMQGTVFSIINDVSALHYHFHDNEYGQTCGNTSNDNSVNLEMNTSTQGTILL